MVFLVHSYALSTNPELAPFGRWISSDLAIKGFFVISGYLVYMSYVNSRSLLDYFEKRARRIYPAYVAVILVCALAGIFLTSPGPARYLSWEVPKYLAANLSFLNFLAPTLPGVFEGNPVQAVNGALWTLKIEVMFYCCVPLISLAVGRWGAGWTMSLLYAFSVTYSLLMLHLLGSTGNPMYAALARQLPGQVTYFVAGMVFYHYRRILERKMRWLLLPGAAILLFGNEAFSLVLEPVALAALVVYFATGFRYLGNFGRYGDLSYGVYIVHFPILQCLVAAGAFARVPYLGLLAAACLVLLAAFISWHGVEKRWLRRSSHYLTAMREA